MVLGLSFEKVSKTGNFVLYMPIPGRSSVANMTIPLLAVTSASRFAGGPEGQWSELNALNSTCSR